MHPSSRVQVDQIIVLGWAEDYGEEEEEGNRSIVGGHGSGRRMIMVVEGRRGECVSGAEVTTLRCKHQQAKEGAQSVGV